MDIKSINLEGLPEPVVRGLEIVVEMARNLSQGHKDHQKKIDLPHWPGNVIGPLDRETIYGDTTDHVA
jgi:hypothetical protein